MKTETKPLSRAEMKQVTGGMPQKYIWYCADYAGGPTGPPGTCAATNPVTFCGEYSCYNTGVLCSGGEYCP